MNCNEYKDKLFAYVDGLLEGSEKEAIVSHLESCSVCRDEVAGIEQLQARLVADGGAYAESDFENAVVDRIVREQTFKLRKTEKANFRVGVWRNIMNTKVTKFAVAAMIIIAVMIGYSLMPTSSGGVVWAKVAEQVARVRAVRYHMNMDMTGIEGMPQGHEMHIEIESLVSADLGLTMNTYVNGTMVSQTFAQIEEQALISLMPAQKKYLRIIMTEEILEKTREENRDPKQMVDGFLTGEYTELGRSEIDGVVVEGVESSDKSLAQGLLGNAVGRLWVDVETGWPVQITIDVIGDDGQVQMELVMDGFEWDVEVDASEFAAEIPEDYELMAEVDLGQLESGAQIADGLGFFAEVTGGKYPSDLAMMTINQELAKAMGAKIASGGEEEPSQEDIQRMMSLQLAGAFFGGLTSEDKDPAYYGDSVTADDADKVLLRWRLDDGQYRVIFGDLRIEDVSVEQLAELEAE